ncbi:MAG TPA: heparan-alpha-glucosaminide N-acetyltransferase domain-containing protein [Anaeromyxobacteraceae bacterium]|nr:heparan-alpha-glucosaminide N-acetyltransferase domain-containing protein [Anaeromyxobacteraceae bacterium]
MAPPVSRKHWLDWQRGLAVLFMVEVHILDAWIAAGARTGHERGYDLLMFLGGLAAPGFLYMAGLSQALADEAQARKGAAPAARRRAAMKRGLWLLGVAYMVRMFSVLVGGIWSWGAGLPYVLGVDVLSVVGFGILLSMTTDVWVPKDWRKPAALGIGLILLSFFWRGAWRWGSWHEVFKVDVLNVLAVGMILSAFLAIGRPRWVGVALTGGLALAVAFATPWVAVRLGYRDEPGFLLKLAADPAAKLADVPWAYLYGLWPRSQFKLLNWVAFLLAGAAVAPLATGKSRPMLFLAIGAGIFGVAKVIDPFIPLPSADPAFWWLNAPSWFLMRLAMHVGLTGALMALPELVVPALRWLSTYGRQSLFAYIVTVELTYGAVADSLRKRLDFRGTVTGIALMIAFGWVLSAGWERFQRAIRERKVA